MSTDIKIHIPPRTFFFSMNVDLNTTIYVHEGSEVVIVGNAFRLLSDFNMKSFFKK